MLETKYSDKNKIVSVQKFSELSSEILPEYDSSHDLICALSEARELNRSLGAALSGFQSRSPLENV